ncbi:ArsJ-associated glyceraldehyde-3-phosphate dehydrogenase [Thalassospira alkalitolerans]|uniref:Glyceraldehyde-3-phosphate dehydrogenase n=1 Tax=Thalassospira alkalitolerans TaxID=1293890 RepID=A0A1Y2L9G7_9PROT|nr:ArsJ-associated glyceraldehyde-3-phosphate dehydrogenase [Thalassospira alkalitolerans]OSQ47167.1 glyceraldehyde-3-phosphate dehydrogenase [Thalassospira alkalitolerans]
MTRKIRIGINGFGRMGRLALRAGWGHPDLEFVHINEIKGGAKTAAHLLEFDSVHGRWPNRVDCVDGRVVIDQTHSLTFSENATPGETDWVKLGCDIVLECTGKFKTPEILQAYFDQGVKKVIVAAPVKQGALNIVYGVNDNLYDPARHHLLTAASCTTNCLAPVVKVIHEKLGIVHGSITTIHDVTNTQTVVDLPHTDLRRARSCLQSLIPTSTGSATAITMIYPELAGKLNGIAVRVPLLNASLTDCVFEVSQDTTVEGVNQVLHEASETYLAGILGYEERPLVSVDYLNDPRSSVIDAGSTMVIDKRQVKILAWYDNEWGYVCRMVDLAAKVAQSL